MNEAMHGSKRSVTGKFHNIMMVMVRITRLFMIILPPAVVNQQVEYVLIIKLFRLRFVYTLVHRISKKQKQLEFRSIGMA